MPLYVFRCPDHGDFEEFVSLRQHDIKALACVTCGKPSVRRPTAAVVIGPVFSNTDALNENLVPSRLRRDHMVVEPDGTKHVEKGISLDTPGRLKAFETEHLPGMHRSESTEVARQREEAKDEQSTERVVARQDGPAAVMDRREVKEIAEAIAAPLSESGAPIDAASYAKQHVAARRKVMDAVKSGAIKPNV